METVEAVYEHLRRTIESSGTIQSIATTGAAVELVMYGSTVNGLFYSMPQHSYWPSSKSDLNLSLVCDPNHSYSEVEVLRLVASELPRAQQL